MPHQNERYGHGYLHHYSLELAVQLVAAFLQTLDQTDSGILRNRHLDRHDAQSCGPCRRKRDVTPATDHPQATGQAAKLTNGDRVCLVLLARVTRYWRYALHIVQPDTLLRWHRGLFRLYWRYKSRKRKRNPRIAQETIEVIRRMADENRLWGAERICGELLKLGMKVSKRDILLK